MPNREQALEELDFLSASDPRDAIMRRALSCKGSAIRESPGEALGSTLRPESRPGE